ncbi:MAG: hypothetical protein K2X49_28760 [Acetobacteraceae bacterium]|nr:hypothetical protein [Acetobacteraceae bacterium]
MPSQRVVLAADGSAPAMALTLLLLLVQRQRRRRLPATQPACDVCTPLAPRRAPAG